MGPLPHLQVQGRPRDLGLAHGQMVPERVAANIETYFSRFAREWGLPRKEVLRRASAYADVIEEVDPAYLESVQGVVDGSGLDFLEVVALNVRYELVYSEYSKLGREYHVPSGCTAFGLLPERTAEGHLLLAQNWDWIPEIQGVVQQYHLPETPEIVSFTEAGIIGGKIGLNDRGLGLLINGLISDQDNWERFGVPFHVRCWQVLQEGTLEEASRRLEGTPGSTSANFLLGEAEGPRLLDVEACPLGTATIPSTSGVLTHANHFHRGKALGIWEPLIDEKTTTFQRQKRADALLQGLATGTKVTMEEVQQFLRDHDGRPGSICRHRDLTLPEEQRYKTVASALMDLDARTLHIAGGNPCTEEFQTFQLSP